MTWYVVITCVFRCPPTSNELDANSPQICNPYLRTVSYLKPHLEPYYHTYAAPYIEKTRPYAQQLDQKFINPASQIAKHNYLTYAAPRIEHAKAFGQQQWEKSILPQVLTAQKKAKTIYGASVAPHIDKAFSVVEPYYGIAKDNEAALAKADSSVVGVSMIGVDARYTLKGLQLRGQLYRVGLSNTDQYNQFTKKGTTLNDLGSAMNGYYVEAGYNVFRPFEKINYELIPFVRLEGYNTHAEVASNIVKKASYKNTVITTGLTLKLAQGAVLKTDLQFVKPDGADSYSKVFSAGLGVMF